MAWQAVKSTRLGLERGEALLCSNVGKYVMQFLPGRARTKAARKSFQGQIPCIFCAMPAFFYSAEPMTFIFFELPDSTEAQCFIWSKLLSLPNIFEYTEAILIITQNLIIFTIESTYKICCILDRFSFKIVYFFVFLKSLKMDLILDLGFFLA